MSEYTSTQLRTSLAALLLLLRPVAALADPGGAYAEPSLGDGSTAPGRDGSGRATPSGGFGTTITIDVPPFHEIAPTISLQYGSTAGNGLAGIGWRVAGIVEIDRRSAGNGVAAYDDSDVFYLEGQPLVECDLRLDPKKPSPGCDHRSGPGRYFITRIESYQRIAFDGAVWTIWHKNGVKLVLDQTITTRTGKPLIWRVGKVTDNAGNEVDYRYTADAGAGAVNRETRYPDEIAYNHHTIKFLWEPRPDPLSAAAGDGSMMWTRKRLHAIDVQTRDGGKRIRAYQLTYKAP